MVCASNESLPGKRKDIGDGNAVEAGVVVGAGGAGLRTARAAGDVMQRQQMRAAGWWTIGAGIRPAKDRDGGRAERIGDVRWP